MAAFITPSGLYSYKEMSSWLRNAPATFQCLMNRAVAAFHSRPLKGAHEIFGDGGVLPVLR